MIAALFAWFMKNPARGAGALGIVLATLTIGWQELRILGKDRSLAAAELSLQKKDVTIGELRQSLAQDESALRLYAQLAEQAMVGQEAAQARAKAAAADAAKALAAVKARPVPKDCAGATQWAVDVAPELMKGWAK